jgi:glutamyl-tRNA synthetase
MAPSPTGFLHVGGLRTALYNFLFARKSDGKFILRIEDTDRARMVDGALENIVQTLAEFKISADEGPYWDNGLKMRGDHGPYYQSERLPIYEKYAKELIEKKFAYYCFCSPQRLEELRNDQQAKKMPPKYDKHCLHLSEDVVKAKLLAGDKRVIRLNVPADKKIKFQDLVHGEIEISTNEIDDQVLIKSDGYPTYHLAVVVDDHLMEISHVIRGDEWIPSTPKHILLYEALGWEMPIFVHLPLLQSINRKKLSKRDGDVSVKDFLDKGYLPEALLNFVALLGWNPKTEQEIFNLRDLIDQFSLEKLNKAWAVFDLSKLDWINGLYIRKMDISELMSKTMPYLKQKGINFENYPKDFLEKILTLEKDRLKKLSEIGERVDYYFKQPVFDPNLLIWKKSTKETTLKNLEKLQGFLQIIAAADFNKDFLDQSIKKFITDNKLTTGEVLWPLRVALTGLEASPGPFEIMDAFGVLPNGKEIILQRISKATEMLF